MPYYLKLFMSFSSFCFASRPIFNFYCTRIHNYHSFLANTYLNLTHFEGSVSTSKNKKFIVFFLFQLAFCKRVAWCDDKIDM